jgi:hypothetical protein
MPYNQHGQWKRECPTNWRHSKRCQCLGKIPVPDILLHEFKRDDWVEFTFVNLEYRDMPKWDKNYPGHWYVVHRRSDKNGVHKMGIKAWRWNIYNNKSSSKKLTKQKEETDVRNKE